MDLSYHNNQVEMIHVLFLPVVLCDYWTDLQASNDKLTDTLSKTLITKHDALSENVALIAKEEYTKFERDFMIPHGDEYQEWIKIQTETLEINQWIHHIQTQMNGINEDIDELKKELSETEKNVKRELGLTVHFDISSVANVIKEQDAKIMIDYNSFTAENGFTVDEYESELSIIAALESQLAVLSNGTSLEKYLTDESVLESLRDRLPRQLSLDEIDLKSQKVEMTAQGLMNKLMLHADEADIIRTLLNEQNTDSQDAETEILLKRLEEIPIIERSHVPLEIFETLLPLFDGTHLSPEKSSQIVSKAAEILSCYNFIETSFDHRHNWNERQRELFADFILRKVESKLALESHLISKFDNVTATRFMISSLANSGLPRKLEVDADEVLALDNEVAMLSEQLNSKAQKYQMSLDEQVDVLNNLLDDFVTAKEYAEFGSVDIQSGAKELVREIQKKEVNLEALAREYDEYYRNELKAIKADNTTIDDRETLLLNLRNILTSLKQATNSTDLNELFITRVAPQGKGYNF